MLIRYSLAIGLKTCWTKKRRSFATRVSGSGVTERPVAGSVDTGLTLLLAGGDGDDLHHDDAPRRGDRRDQPRPGLSRRRRAPRAARRGGRGAARRPQPVRPAAGR